MPQEFKLETTGKKDITTADGDVYGQFEITKNNTVLITFSDIVSQRSEVGGNLKIKSTFNQEVIKEPGHYEVTLPVKENANFDFDIKPTQKFETITKQGEVDTTKNTSAITWTVNVNQNYETLENVKVTDAMPQGLTLDSVEVYPLNLDVNGNFVSLGDKLSNDKIAINGSDVTFKETIKQPYRIVYKTIVDENQKPATGGNVDFHNTASIQVGNEAKIDASASIQAQYGRILAKRNTEINGETQTLKWNVVYNAGEKTLKTPTLVDTFDADLEYVADSLKISGPAGILNPSEYTLEVVNNTMTIKFKNDVTEEYTLTYDTKVKEGVLITDNKTFENTIIDKETQEKTGGSGTVSQQLVQKWGYNIDYKQKTVQWDMIFNKNNYELNNYTIEDSYTAGGLTLKPETLQVFDNTKRKHLEINVDYKLELTTENGVEKGFKLSFIGAYAQTSSSIRVMYTTDYDMNQVNDPSSNRLVNSVTLNWTDYNGKEQKNTTTTYVEVNEVTRNNGQKSGSYNAKTKEISWNVEVNYTSETLKDATVVDTIQDGQQYIDGSLLVTEYTVAADGTISKASEVDLSTLEIDYPSASNGQTLKVNLPDTDKKYGITFKTSVESTLIKDRYDNKAEFTNGTRIRNLDAHVSVKHGNSLISKTGIQEGDNIHWEALINGSQSTLSDVVVKDTPSSNQNILKDTIVIMPMVVGEDGSLSEGSTPLVLDTDYTVNVAKDDTGLEYFEITFKNKIDRAYTLKYTTFFNLIDNNNKATNDISLTANKNESVTNEKESTININTNELSSEAKGERGSFTIQKVDEQGQPLEGVTFELMHPKGHSLGTQVTDVDGKINYDKLLYIEYVLKELETLPGYVIQDEYVSGVNVKVNRETSSPEYVWTVVNGLNTVTVDKVDEAGTPLSGAKFKLLAQQDNGEYKQIKENLEAIDGKVTLSGLVAGHYQIIETEAAEGYVLNTTPVEFEITLDAQGNAVYEPIQYVNYQGSVNLTKVNDNEEILEGVVFDLYDANNTLVAQDLKTDDKGQIRVDGLAPGNYSFVETQSVDGYIVNTAPLHFVIAASADDKPATVEVKATNYKGSSSMMKLNEFGEGLEGAHFEIQKEGTDAVIEVVSNEQGLVVLDQLGAGTYTLKEIKAPNGYLLNTETRQFEIPATTVNSDKVVVTVDALVNYQGSVTLAKTNEENTALAGVRFNVLDATGKIVAEDLQTDEAGMITLDQLAPGRYTMVETASVDGYIVKTTPIEFEIVDTFEGKPEPVALETTNFKGSVEMIKTDAQGNPLSGVEFSLVQEGSDAVQTLVSDDQGRVQADKLAVGHYTLRETKTVDGYILNTEVRSFEIPETTELDAVVIKLDDFVNYQGRVQLTKTDDTDANLPGVVFNLMDENGNVVHKNLVSDENGQIVVEGLAPGSYTFVEVKALDGYILNENPLAFEITAENEGQPELVEVSMRNFKGSMEMIKTDDLGNPLEGAEFALQREGDTEIQTLISDADGRISADQLVPGNYTLREVKAAQGYLLNTEIREFEIQEKTQSDRVHVALQNFVNYQGSLKVSKVDETGSLLEEASFEVRDAQNNVIASFETKQGMASIKNLKPGSYTLHETVAPNGYQLSTQIVSFEIASEADGKPNTVAIDFINKKLEDPEIDGTNGNKPDPEVDGNLGEVPEVLGTNRPYLPATGMSNTPIFVALSLVTLGAILILIRRKKKA